MKRRKKPYARNVAGQAATIRSYEIRRTLYIRKRASVIGTICTDRQSARIAVQLGIAARGMCRWQNNSRQAHCKLLPERPWRPLARNLAAPKGSLIVAEILADRDRIGRVVITAYGGILAIR